MTSRETSEGGRLTRQFLSGNRTTSAVLDGFLFGAIAGAQELEPASEKSLICDKYYLETFSNCAIMTLLLR